MTTGSHTGIRYYIPIYNNTLHNIIIYLDDELLTQNCIFIFYLSKTKRLIPYLAPVTYLDGIFGTSFLIFNTRR